MTITETIDGINIEYEFTPCVRVAWKANDTVVFYQNTLDVLQETFDAMTDDQKRAYVVADFNRFRDYLKNPLSS